VEARGGEVGGGGYPPGVNPLAGARRGASGYVGWVFSSVAKRWGPGLRKATGAEPPAGPADVPPVIDAIRFLILIMVLVTVPLSTPNPRLGTASVAVAVTLGVAAVAWIVWLVTRHRFRLMVAALIVMAAAGGALAGIATLSPAVAVGCVVAASAGARLNTEASAAITAETLAAFLITGVATGAPAGALAGYSAMFIGLWAFGLTRRAYVMRAEEAERALEQTRRALEAETQAAALAERARIAREIHDVLAHSLAAVSVNLQAAEGLLSEIPDGSPELAKAIECVERAGAFTREGMAETRRAIMALRGGSAPPPAPLAGQLEALAAEYAADGDMTVDLRLSGSPRPVGAEAGLTAYRTAQEALTNARKHAPGQPVTVSLRFEPAEIVVRVANPLPSGATAGPLAAAGAGYGLTGLRERAALGGGTLTAGPADGQWQVCLTLPS
jgi:signal transduction histidine kinase